MQAAWGITGCWLLRAVGPRLRSAREQSGIRFAAQGVEQEFACDLFGPMTLAHLDAGDGNSGLAGTGCSQFQ